MLDIAGCDLATDGEEQLTWPYPGLTPRSALEGLLLALLLGSSPPAGPPNPGPAAFVLFDRPSQPPQAFFRGPDWACSRPVESLEQTPIRNITPTVTNSF